MGDYIKQYITESEEYIENKLSGASAEESEQFIKEFEQKILYFQHERLIHLLVTLAFAMFELFEIYVVFTADSFYKLIFAALLTVILLVLVVAYIMHYYLLENSVQKMYHMRDKAKSIIKSQN